MDVDSEFEDTYIQHYIQGLQNLYGKDGKFHPTFKSGTESVDFPSHF